MQKDYNPKNSNFRYLLDYHFKDTYNHAMFLLHPLYYLCTNNLFANLHFPSNLITSRTVALLVLTLVFSYRTTKVIHYHCYAYENIIKTTQCHLQAEAVLSSLKLVLLELEFNFLITILKYANVPSRSLHNGDYNALAVGSWYKWCLDLFLVRECII